MSTTYRISRSQKFGLIVLLGGLFLSGCAGVTGAINPQATKTSVAPSITTQPVSQDVTTGQKATFTVAATGTAPLGYQWRKNGTAISGATSSSYTTPATTASDDRALFSVVVNNSVGNATSSTATLNVGAAAGVVAVQVTPSNVSVPKGSTQQFAATVTGTSNTAVTWSVTGTGCSGAACGTISGGGLYTPPANMPSPATLRVTGTSVADPTKSASANVTLVLA